MVKAWQYYYFLIRDLNADVKVMNAYLCENLPPEAHLEALGGASEQQDLRGPSRALCFLCPTPHGLPGSQAHGGRRDRWGCDPSC